ncbi:hypothetical protein BJ742DRAFT_812703 [Cladochytrium replicatum]|nr:hypothetical protein BJ742DRAFT_812703 [Cladochytrium replicatum]
MPSAPLCWRVPTTQIFASALAFVIIALVSTGAFAVAFTLGFAAGSSSSTYDTLACSGAIWECWPQFFLMFCSGGPFYNRTIEGNHFTWVWWTFILNALVYLAQLLLVLKARFLKRKSGTRSSSWTVLFLVAAYIVTWVLAILVVQFTAFGKATDLAGKFSAGAGSVWAAHLIINIVFTLLPYTWTFFIVSRAAYEQRPATLNVAESQPDGTEGVQGKGKAHAPFWMRYKQQKKADGDDEYQMRVEMEQRRRKENAQREKLAKQSKNAENKQTEQEDAGAREREERLNRLKQGFSEVTVSGPSGSQPDLRVSMAVVSDVVPPTETDAGTANGTYGGSDAYVVPYNQYQPGGAGYQPMPSGNQLSPHATSAAYMAAYVVNPPIGQPVSDEVPSEIPMARPYSAAYHSSVVPAVQTSPAPYSAAYHSPVVPAVQASPSRYSAEYHAPVVPPVQTSPPVQTTTAGYSAEYTSPTSPVYSANYNQPSRTNIAAPSYAVAYSATSSSGNTDSAAGGGVHSNSSYSSHPSMLSVPTPAPSTALFPPGIMRPQDDDDDTELMAPPLPIPTQSNGTTSAPYNASYGAPPAGASSSAASASQGYIAKYDAK